MSDDRLADAVVNTDMASIAALGRCLYPDEMADAIRALGVDVVFPDDASRIAELEAEVEGWKAVARAKGSIIAELEAESVADHMRRAGWTDSMIGFAMDARYQAKDFPPLPPQNDATP